jgi:PmbA protein
MVFTPGQSTLEQLMGQAGKATLVTDFNGGNCDPSTGYFSYGIEGFLVQGGVIVQPVSGMNVTGNMLDLWKSLVAVGNDADPWEAELIPSLMFSDVNFSGI